MDITDNLPTHYVDQPPPGRLSTFVDILRWRGQRIADQVAFRFLSPANGQAEEISYGGLDTETRKIAAALGQLGRPGQRVLIVQQPGLHYIASLLACLRARMVAVPVYPLDVFRLRHTLPRLQAITQDAGARILLTSGEAFGEGVSVQGAAAVAGDAGPNAAETALAGPLWQLCNQGVIRTDRLDPALADGFVEPTVREDEVAILQYTSGTTGSPRGVALCHRHLVANARQIYTSYHVPDAVCIFWLPPYHDMGLVGGLLLPLYAGRLSVLMSPTSFVQQPLAWLQAISDYRGTTTASPNFGFELCLRKVSDEALQRLDLSSLRVAICGAEPIRGSTMRRFIERFEPAGFRASAFTPAYGMAEATLAITGKPREAEPVAVGFDPEAICDRRPRAIPLSPQAASGPRPIEVVGCGVPLVDNEVLVVDPGTRRLLGEGEIGEIWLRGPAVAERYWGQPQLSAETFGATPVVDDGERLPSDYLRTGDLGFIHDQQLFVSGRLKDLVIVGGRNYFAHEIQAAVQATHEALKVDGGVVFSASVDSDDPAGERLVVVQEVLRPKRWDLQELAERVRLCVAEQFELAVDEVVLVVAGSLVKTSSGKLQRWECCQAYLRGQLSELHRWRRGTATPSLPLGADAAGRAATAACPRRRRGPVADRLASIWCEVLRLDAAEDEQHFLDHGGQSLAAMELLSRIRQQLGVTLEFASLFRAPRFGQLVTSVEAALASGDQDHHGDAATSGVVAATDGRWPLTASQRRFWLLDQLGLHQAFLHVELSLRLTGTIDRDRLAEAIAELPKLHTALRVRLETDQQGTAWLRQVDDLPIEVQRLELGRGLASADDGPNDSVEERLVRFRRRWVERPFDLARGKVFRAAIVSLPGGQTELILAAHHLVCDGTSLAILAHDLATLHNSGDATAAAIPQRWQAPCERVCGEGLQYWAQRLEGCADDMPLALSQPLGDDVSAEQATDAGSRYLRLSLSDAVTSRLQQRCQQWRVTPFELLLTAWHSVLARYVATDEVLVGVPIAGRDAATQRAVGCFINTLPIRLGPEPEGPFAEAVARTSQLFRRDMSWGQVPVDAIIDRVNPARHEQRLPLVQHLVLHQPPVDGSLELPPARCVDVHSDYSMLAAYDTALVCQWRGGGSCSPGGQAVAGGLQGEHLELGLAFSPARVPERFARQMLDRLVALLDQALRQPERAIDRLAASGRPEVSRQQLGAPAGQHRHQATVLEMFAQRLENGGDSVALVDAQGPLTFAELATQADRLAGRWLAAGIASGDLVALRLNRSRRMVIAALAVWKCGAAYLPIDPSYPAPRIEAILADAQPARIISDEDFDVWEAAPETVDVPALPGAAGASPDGLAYLIYTSGSSGEPKGVMIGHDNLANVLASFAAQPGLAAGQRILASTTMSFDISVLELFLPLVTGASAVIAPRSLSEDPDAVLAWIAEQPVDVIQATPSSLRMMIATGWSPRAGQTIWCGGEPLQRDLAESILAAGATLWNVYGPTETTVWSLIQRIEWPLRGPISIGRPIDATTIRIVDSRGRDVPEGVDGELWIGGAGVGRGYWQRPQLTSERFVDAGRWGRMYRSGDRVRWLSDGGLEFLGRSDRQIKLRGHRIELGEIEASLVGCEGVAEAAVVCLPSGPTDQRLVAFYTVSQTATPAPSDLRRWLALRLPCPMVPSAFVALDEIPHTPAGKIDYRRLPLERSLTTAAADGREHAGTASARPLTPTEQRVADAWREVLGDLPGGVDDDFFMLGGHSLSAAQVFARLRTRHGIDVPLRTIYEHRTIASLASLIDATATAASEAGQAAVAGSLAAWLDEWSAGPLAGADDEPLSPAEQRLWFVDQLEPNHPFYNLPLAARVDGPLDLARFWRAVDACVARHETLRSTYVMVDGQPRRRVAERVELPRLSQDLRPRHDAAAVMQAEIARLSRLPFDLANGPLLRVAHWRLHDQQHVILLVMHHIVSDGWSMGVMMRELAECYRADLEGRAPQLPRLDVTYRQYAAWQQQSLSARRVAPALEYWQQALAGAPETLDLPADFPRPAVQNFAGATIGVALDADESARVRQVADQLGVTPYAVLMASLGLTLSRWSGQRDLSIGTAVANRTDPLVEPLVGFFVNTVVVRQRPRGEESFAQYVRQVQRWASQALEHQEVPFEQVVSHLASRRDRSHSPLFQAAFILQNTPDALVAADGLTLTPMAVDNGTAKYDVTLSLVERNGQFSGQFEYRTSLFRAATIGRLSASWKTLLAAGLAQLDTAVDELPMVAADERRKILARSIGPRRPAPARSTLLALFDAATARHPARVAVRHRDRSFSYAQLNRHAGAMARGLQCCGVLPRDTAQATADGCSATGQQHRVVVYLPRSIDQIAASIAVMRCGAAFVPIDTQVPLARLAAIVADLQPAAVIAPEAMLAAVRQHGVANAAAAPPCLSPGDLATLDDGDWRRAAVGPDDLAYLIYTSGSTGTPKGVAIEHRAVSHFALAFGQRLAIEVGTVCSHLFSPSFDGAIGDIYPALAHGGCIEVIDAEVAIDPPRLAQLLTDRRVELVAMTLATLGMLQPEQLPAVRKILSAGMSLPRELAARYLQSHELYNGYGPTECAVGVAIHRLTDDDLNVPSVGGPIDNAAIYVLDPAGRLVPDGVIGQVHLGGLAVGRGYWNRDELTRQSFVADPFYRLANEHDVTSRMYCSGDLGRWNANGRLEIVGRSDAQLKLRGFRIEPDEIAAVIDATAGVSRSAVIAQGADDQGAGRRLVAYVVADQDRLDSEPLLEDGAAGGAEQEHVDNWRRLFDESQQTAPLVLDPMNNFVGWTSMITGQPIPIDQMRRWADATAQRIRDLAPRRLLEVGCGTGLILLRIGDAVERYVGVDVLESALQELHQTLRGRPQLHGKVMLLARAADALDDLESGQFDTIVLNSVVQYFPSERYLIKVLQGAQRLLAPGGRIFLGDLRNHRLHRAFAIAVELERRGGAPLTVEQFLGRVRNRVEHDEELLVDPDLWHHLSPHLKRLRDVRTQVKTADGDNELNRFRFDAVLGFDTPLDRPRRPGVSDGEAAQQVAVANPHVQQEVQLDQQLAVADRQADLDEVLQRVTAALPAATTPADLRQRASAQAIELRVDWHGDRDDQIVLEGHAGDRPVPADRLRMLLDLPPALSKSDGPAATRVFTNRPLGRRRLRRLVARVRQRLQQQLPAYMVPAAIVTVDHLPLTIQGKLDQAALPAPPTQRASGEDGFRAPQDSSQRQLAAIWEELLEVSPVGIDDDFFELGGHSMLAVRMVALVQQRTGRTLPLAALFRKPTVRQLAELLDHPPAETATIVPLSLEGSGAPLFCIHPAGGTVFCYRELAQRLAGYCPVYGVQARGVDGTEKPHASLAEMASDYAEAIHGAVAAGPIHLAGWSLGGNIAQEVARQLHSRGRRVETLALLDAGLVEDRDQVREEDFLPLIAALFPGQDHCSLDQLRTQSPEQQLDYFVTQAAKAGIVPERSESIGTHVFEVFQANIKVVHEHQVRPHGGPLLLIRPADQMKTAPRFEDPTLGWDRFTDRVDIQHVPGDHAHMLQPPAVDRIAEILRQQLSAAPPAAVSRGGLLIQQDLAGRTFGVPPQCGDQRLGELG